MEVATLARRLVAIKVFFRYLFQERIIGADITDVMDSPKLWRILPEFMSTAEVDAFLNAFSANSKDPLTLRNRCILEMMYACGLRVSETAGLKLGSLNFDEDIVRVFGKGSKERIVPMGRTAVGILRRYLEKSRPELISSQEEPMLFVSNRGKPLNRERIWAVVKDAAKIAGIKKIFTRILCAIPLPAICWKTAPICGSFRRCWGMRTSARRRFTLMWISSGSCPFIRNFIRGHN